MLIRACVPDVRKLRLREKVFGGEAYLAREHREIKGFPDCFFVNEDYVICIDQAQINASDPRSNYENGDEYRVFLANHKDLLEKEEYEKLEEYLVEEGILFRQENLEKSLLHVLNSKLPKTAGYKRAAHDYIASGDNLLARRRSLQNNGDMASYRRCYALHIVRSVQSRIFK